VFEGSAQRNVKGVTRILVLALFYFLWSREDMQILSDSELRKLVDAGLMKSVPKDEQMQPASIDLRLGMVYKQRNSLGVIDLTDTVDENEFLEEVPFDDTLGELVLNPDYFVVLETLETVQVPEGVVGRVMQRS